MTDSPLTVGIKINALKLMNAMAKAIELKVEKTEPITVPAALKIGRDVLKALSEQLNEWSEDRFFCMHISRNLGIDQHMDLDYDMEVIKDKINSTDGSKEIKDLLHNMLKEAFRNAKNAH